MKVALYFRQSLDAQEGIDRQRARCVKLAADRGWTVVAEYVDNAASATKLRSAKSAWAKMLADHKTGAFTTVVAVDLDRLLRTQRDLVTLIDGGIKIVTVDGEIDLSTADGEFRASVGVAVARFEVKRKAERQKRAADFRANDGRVIAGKRAFGYEGDRKTVRESEAVHLRAAFKTIIEGGSISSVVRSLNEQGVRTSTGSVWSGTQLKKVLLAPRNAGMLVQRGQVIRNESDIQQIITPEDHALFLAVMAGHGNIVHGPRKAENWLSSLMTCGVCGQKMLVKNAISKGTKTRMYQCSAALHNHGADSVSHVYMNADIAESAVKLALYAEANKAARWGAPNEEADATLRELSERLVAIRAERTRASEALLEEDVDKPMIRARLAAIAVRLAEAEKAQALAHAGSAEIAAMGMLIRDPRNEGDFEFTQRWMAWWEDLDSEARRALVRATVSIQIAKGGKGAKRVVVSAR